jgi:hypothetical protein
MSPVTRGSTAKTDDGIKRSAQRDYGVPNKG